MQNYYEISGLWSGSPSTKKDDEGMPIYPDATEDEAVRMRNNMRNHIRSIANSVSKTRPKNFILIASSPQIAYLRLMEKYGVKNLGEYPSERYKSYKSRVNLGVGCIDDVWAALLPLEKEDNLAIKRMDEEARERARKYREEQARAYEERQAAARKADQERREREIERKRKKAEDDRIIKEALEKAEAEKKAQAAAEEEEPIAPKPKKRKLDIITLADGSKRVRQPDGTLRRLRKRKVAA